MRWFGDKKYVMDTLIGKNGRFEGELSAKETVRIDGWFKGKILCEDALILGAEGRVEGELTADRVLIAGEVLGNVIARSYLQITGNGKVYGDVTTPRLLIDQGVVFEGRCHMLPRAETLDGEEVQVLLAPSRETAC